MEEEPRSIFRKEALLNWINQKETENLPGLVSPRLFVFLWIIFGFLMALGFWVSCAEVKTYTFGQGFVADFEDDGPEEYMEKPRVVSFFPEDMGLPLSEGDRLWIRSMDERQWHGHTIVAVEPGSLSPAEVRERFGLVIPRPVRAVISHLDDAVTPESSRDLPGHRGLLEVRVQSGTRKMASFLPLVGDLFEKE